MNYCWIVLTCTVAALCVRPLLGCAGPAEASLSCFAAEVEHELALVRAVSRTFKIPVLGWCPGKRHKKGGLVSSFETVLYGISLPLKASALFVHSLFITLCRVVIDWV